MGEKLQIRAAARACGYGDLLIRVKPTGGATPYYIVEALGCECWATGPLDRVLAQIGRWPRAA